MLAACAVLALAGGLLRRPGFSLVAVALLLAAWLPGLVRQRRAGALLAWLVLAALLLVPAAFGQVQLALMALPVVFLGGVAWLFARSLRRDREPLVSRCVRVIEGAPRLALPGVRAYTRAVTWFWAWLLGVLATGSLLLALLAQPGGWLAAFGWPLPLALPGSLLAWYPEAGCWAVLLAAFAGEYLFRRWHLRHLEHAPLHRFLLQLARCWPQLLRDMETGA